MADSSCWGQPNIPERISFFGLCCNSVQECALARMDYNCLCTFEDMKKGGYCNFYVGYGHKWTQANWG